MNEPSTLGELLEAIDTLDSDLTLYAPDSRPLSAGSPGMVAAEADGSGRVEAVRELVYLLEVYLAREVIDVWSTWRNGRVPTRDERVAAVAFYADNDAYQPVDSKAGSG